MAIGALSKENYERWRGDHVDYLEHVCKVNLGKLADVNRKIRAFVKRINLKASWTEYHCKSGKGNNVRLRFSKSGVENIERAYAMHYVSQDKIKKSEPQEIGATNSGS